MYTKNICMIALGAISLLYGCTQPESEPVNVPDAAQESPAAAEVTVEAPAPAVETPMEEARPEAGAIGAPPAIDVATLALTIDPVCKMSLEEYPATATHEFEGKTYGFCSVVCQKKFVEGPAAILARLEAAPPEPAPAQ